MFCIRGEQSQHFITPISIISRKELMFALVVDLPFMALTQSMTLEQGGLVFGSQFLQRMFLTRKTIIFLRSELRYFVVGVMDILDMFLMMGHLLRGNDIA